VEIVTGKPELGERPDEYEAVQSLARERPHTGQGYRSVRIAGHDTEMAELGRRVEADR
jgi:hypothetical protein